MRKPLIVAAVCALGAGPAGCGGDSSSSTNDDAMRRAHVEYARAAAFRAQVLARLRAKLKLNRSNRFALHQGGRCWIQGVYLGDAGDFYRHQVGAYTSPDGKSVIVVDATLDPRTGHGWNDECFAAVSDALGW